MIVGVDCVMDTKGASGYANPSTDPWQEDDSTVLLYWTLVHIVNFWHQHRAVMFK
jgi:hypothetical protein